jgi:hypothetical protein
MIMGVNKAGWCVFWAFQPAVVPALLNQQFMGPSAATEYAILVKKSCWIGQGCTKCVNLRKGDTTNG